MRRGSANQTRKPFPDWLIISMFLGRDEGQPQPAPSPADRQRRDVEAMLRAMSEADLEKVYDYARFITRDKK